MRNRLFTYSCPCVYTCTLFCLEIKTWKIYAVTTGVIDMYNCKILFPIFIHHLWLLNSSHVLLCNDPGTLESKGMTQISYIKGRAFIILVFLASWLLVDHNSRERPHIQEYMGNINRFWWVLKKHRRRGCKLVWVENVWWICLWWELKEEANMILYKILSELLKIKWLENMKNSVCLADNS